MFKSFIYTFFFVQVYPYSVSLWHQTTCWRVVINEVLGSFSKHNVYGKQERHLKMQLRVSAIIFQLFKVSMLEKCVLTILELNWNQCLGHKNQCLGQKLTFVIICSRRPHNCKTGHFTS